MTPCSICLSLSDFASIPEGYFCQICSPGLLFSLTTSNILLHYLFMSIVGNKKTVSPCLFWMKSLLWLLLRFLLCLWFSRIIFLSMNFFYLSCLGFVGLFNLWIDIINQFWKIPSHNLQLMLCQFFPPLFRLQCTYVRLSPVSFKCLSLFSVCYLIVSF